MFEERFDESFESEEQDICVVTQCGTHERLQQADAGCGAVGEFVM